MNTSIQQEYGTCSICGAEDSCNVYGDIESFDTFGNKHNFSSRVCSVCTGIGIDYLVYDTDNFSQKKAVLRAMSRQTRFILRKLSSP